MFHSFFHFDHIPASTPSSSAKMATYQVQPPENFTFSKPEEWPKWFKRFERFLIASELNSKEEIIQINTLIYAMGNDAEDIFHSFALTGDDAKTFKTVVDRFQAHFVTRRNTIFERAKFNHRRQQDGESADSFITALYTLVEHCEYGQLKDEMIRDRIVVGIRDSKMSEKLQLDPNLTLEKAVAQVRQREAVQKQQSVVRDESGTTSVDAIHKGRNNRQGKKKNSYNKTQPQDTGRQNRQTFKNQSTRGTGGQKSCHRCGNVSYHAREKCPAANVECYKCHKLGHFAKKCTSKVLVDEIQGAAFLGAIDSSDNSEPWKVNLTLEKCHMEFKIDTGADVTAIPEHILHKLGTMKLQRSDRILLGPGKTRLDVAGKFVGTLKSGKSKISTEIYVVNGLSKPLLGRPAIEKLDLVKRVASVKSKDYVTRYPALFKGLGKLNGEYEIRLRSDSKPVAVSTPRRIPLPLLDKVEVELKRMESLGVISPVDEPTDWCAGLVVVPKKNNTVRLCVDLTELNKSVRRENHQLPSTEDTLHKLSGAKVFSKLDANSGFWQVQLAKSSRLLTTFITPFGRYCFNRLPFGISSAPEYFQKRMQALLSGLPGVLCQMDDVLIFGDTQEDHDLRLESVLERLLTAGITLNGDKCEFSKESITFVGHVIDASGIRPDPKKVEAIVNFQAPTNVPEVRRFMGMVNQLGRFTPNLAEHSKPIRDLLQKESSWIWEAPQIQAFDRIKKELSSTPLLALYDPKARTKISADASSFGLGAVLLQCPKGSEESEDVWKPVAYASRAMSSTEQRYAQVEKEALAVTWACEKFADFVIGMTFLIETDHKPLVSLLGTKAMSDLPPRIQRFRMRLARYHYEIKHVPGKFLYTADTLSRAPLQSMTPEEEDFESDVEAFVDSVVMSLPASETRLEELRKAIHEDSVLSVITKYCQEGWPGFEKPSINVVTRPYWQIREEITLCQGLLMRGNRLIIPTYLRAEILQRIHEGHQGIVKYCERARNSVWWPRINREIEDLVRNCTICVKQKADHAEPLRPTPFPERPWQKVGSDLFQIKNAIYLLVVDYFSRYIEIALLKSTSSQAVINHMQSIFARHGIPETVVSDNGPQYASEAFVKFAKDYGFCHETSSPYYPQGNAEAERAVQTIKRAIRNASDPYQALLAYRATPLKCGYSPAELLMGRRLRTTLPENPQNFTPKWPDLAQIRERETRERETQKENFDCSHQARSLPKLQPGQAVWVRGPGGGFGGTVTSSAGSDRSYVIETPTGQVRRNRRHLVSAPMLIPENPQVEDHDDHEKTVNSSSVRESLKTVTPKITVQTETLSPENIVQTHDQNTRTSSSTPGRTVTRSGRVSKPVKKMNL